MLRAFVALPAAFVATTVKLNTPVVVGMPEIAPVFQFRLKPFGILPPEINQDIGVVPLAASVSLYAVPTVPDGRDVVVIVGAT